ncbi:MAG: hypothetical protein SO412_05415 [Erysipelotrichaceae bacterium]|nr:hypothetical protein [Erysipelotrichaceae bacterium]
MSGKAQTKTRNTFVQTAAIQYILSGAGATIAMPVTRTGLLRAA